MNVNKNFKREWKNIHRLLINKLRFNSQILKMSKQMRNKVRKTNSMNAKMIKA